MFLRLRKNFRPIAHDDYFELFDNLTVDEYELDKEQYQLTLELNGSKTRQDILTSYDNESQAVANEFLHGLEKLGAVEELPSSQIRTFPQNTTSPYLEAVLWDITSHCNLACTHCYVSGYSLEARGQDLTTDEIYRVIDEMNSINVRDVSLTGGEPLMRRDIRDIIRRITNTDIRLASLFTNGIAVDQNLVAFLASEVPGRFRVRHSLDGMTPESNAVLRGDRMEPNLLFRKMVESIKLFVDARILVSVGTGVHRHNVRDIPKMYSFMKDLGVEQWRMAVPKPIGRFAATQNETGASWDEILEAYRQLIDLRLGEVRVVDGKTTAPISIEIEQVFRTELVSKTMNGFQEDDLSCFYHKNRCSVKANGDVTPCGYFDDVVAGNLRKGSLRCAWESITMQKIKHLRVSDVSECRNCQFLSRCGAGCRAVARKAIGNITSKDPYACQQAPFLADVVMPLFKKHGFTMNVSEGCSEFSDLRQETI